MQSSPKKEAVLVVLLQSILVRKVAILQIGCHFKLLEKVIKCVNLDFREFW